MTKKINIAYMIHRRPEFADLIMLLLSRCKFKDFHFTVCCTTNKNSLKIGEEVVRRGKEIYGLDASTLTVPQSGYNYKFKLQKVTTYPNEYSIKMDEDIFMGPKAWDALFENISILDDPKKLLITPNLSSGIPTCDDFIKENLNEQEQAAIFSTFANTNIPNLWGADYSGPNATLSQGYDSDRFYNAVNKVRHVYKGIHPIRVGWEAQKQINALVLDNLDLFLQDRNFAFVPLNRPYICNSFFAIRTDMWYDIIHNNQDLAVDNFDEVTLNRYRHKYNKQLIRMSNSFGIHTVYNTLHCFMKIDKQTVAEHERDFVDKIHVFVKNQFAETQ